MLLFLNVLSPVLFIKQLLDNHSHFVWFSCHRLLFELAYFCRYPIFSFAPLPWKFPLLSLFICFFNLFEYIFMVFSILSSEHNTCLFLVCHTTCIPLQNIFYFLYLFLISSTCFYLFFYRFGFHFIIFTFFHDIMFFLILIFTIWTPLWGFMAVYGWKIQLSLFLKNNKNIDRTLSVFSMKTCLLIIKFRIATNYFLKLIIVKWNNSVRNASCWSISAWKFPIMYFVKHWIFHSVSD